MNWKGQSYTRNDLPAIAQFLNGQYPGRDAYGGMDLFQWKIVDNYLMPGVINLVKDGDRICSIASVTPKRLMLDGHEMAAGEIADAYTDSAYQRQGMFPLLARQSTQEALNRGMDIVYSTPDRSSPSLQVFEKKANYLQMNNLYLSVLSLPINLTPVFQRKMHWLLANYAGAIAATFEFLGLAVQKMASPTMSVDEVSEIPDDWEEFWQSCAARYDFLLARDRAAMEWRFFRHPDNYTLFVARSEGKISGYAVCRIIHGDELSVMCVADYLFRPGTERNLRSVLVHIVSAALHAGVAAVNVWCPTDNPHCRVFRQFGFLARGRVALVAFRNELTESLAQRKLRWHFTLADSDNV